MTELTEFQKKITGLLPNLELRLKMSDLLEKILPAMEHSPRLVTLAEE